MLRERRFFGKIRHMAKRSHSGKKPLRMPRRASLFWDTDPKKLDEKKHARYIMERVLDFGNKGEVQWLVNRYSARQIKAVLSKPRTTLHKKSQALWSTVFA
jgi:hypothetical protein